MRYNDVVQTYNSTVRKFPKSIFAGILGFNQRQYFEISEADAEVPKVNF